MSTIAISGNQSKSFHKFTFEECRTFYTEDLVDAAGYILLIVKCHGAAGWKWSFKVKDFCKEWNIPQRTFYYAISKLREKKLLHWEIKDTITVWYGTDIAKEHDTNTIVNEHKYPAIDCNATNGMSINTLQCIAQPVQPIAIEVPQIAQPVQLIAIEIPETLATKELQNPPDYIHTSTEFSDSVEEEFLGAEAPQELAIEKPTLKIKDVPEQPLTPSVINPDLESHLEAVKQGIEPPEDIKQQLLEHPGYAPTYAVFAKRYKWERNIQVSEIPDSARELVQRIKERGKYKVPK